MISQDSHCTKDGRQKDVFYVNLQMISLPRVYDKPCFSVQYFFFSHSIRDESETDLPRDGNSQRFTPFNPSNYAKKDNKYGIS